jgi:cysteinyl-tRNA synthetase
MSVSRLLGDGGRGLGPEGLAGLVRPDAEALIDLHSGGEDNIFPHHECEMAQSCCAFNESPGGGGFARHWVHARFLLVNGEKMSKSKGNFYTPRDLFERGVEPAAVRLELIRTHYRANANFTDQGLVDSQRMVERWRRVLGAGGAAPAAAPRAPSAVEREFAEAMDDDLNVARAIAAVNTWAGSLGTPTAEDAAVMAGLDAVLGVLGLERPGSRSTAIAVYLPGASPDDRVEGLLERRRRARAAKDFATSDRIRDELAGLGYAIKDVAGGRVEVSRR